MFSKLAFVISMLLLFGNPSENNGSYHREYHENGKLKAEGWMKDGMKTNFWKFYHKNGQLSEQGHYKNDRRFAYWKFYDKNGNPLQEGHYRNGRKMNWWLFYDENGKINHKCQLNNGKKNGYCLKYDNEKLTSAEKYQNGKKIKEWFSLGSFKKENSLSDLR